jgi:ferredoxin
MTAPDVFQLREEDGQAYVTSENVSPDQEAVSRLAMQSCPERAITID